MRQSNTHGQTHVHHEQELGAPATEVPDVYRAWLRRHYHAYIGALLGLLTGKQHTAGVQVAATVAVMESVRSEAGVGVFANELYARLLTAVATAEGVKPEVGSCVCVCV